MSAADELTPMAGRGVTMGGRIDSISLGAVASLIMTMASILGCLTSMVVGTLVTPAAFIVIMILPIPALLGAALGGWSLRNISRSQGRLGGRSMALIGLFLGLIAATLQGAVAGSALATFWPVRAQVAPVVAEFVRHVESGNLASARILLSPSASHVVTDQRMRALLAPSTHRLGAFQHASFGLDVFVDSFNQVRESSQRAAAAGGIGLGGPGDPPKPVGLGFARGRVLMYVFLDQSILDQGRVEILDLLLVNKKEPATALLPDGPATQAARAMGLPLAGASSTSP